MSRATKRKHVLKEILEDDYALPTENQQIVKIVKSRGNNLHEVVTPIGDSFLVSMPTKFRKNIWVKRGDFVLIEPIEEGDKVKAEMVRVLTNVHVKLFKKDGVWPVPFDVQKEEATSDDLYINTNRIVNACESDSATTDSEDETSSDDSDCFQKKE